MKHEDLISPL